jgi:hypothetical protein
MAEDVVQDAIVEAYGFGKITGFQTIPWLG